MDLPKRLAALAAFIPHGSIAADIGTDHAYLPIFLIKQGICRFVIATDLREGPFQSAVHKIKEHVLEDRIGLRLGDGLQPLKPGEAEVVVLAGMGGNTIRGILAGAPQTLAGIKRLVLQPMTDAGDLRVWLAANGWKIADEELVEDDGRIYVIIAAEPGREVTYDPVYLELGPRLLEKRSPLLGRHLNGFMVKYERVLAGLALAHSTAAREKALEIEGKVARIREVAACL
ncbi:MAG: class I SAM-dependent methyltransferase [Desulfotomaculaceae bacterium]|nr:class I SAM-dependent methyltransferase [Desulfotomaculaceae bacterium]